MTEFAARRSILQATLPRCRRSAPTPEMPAHLNRSHGPSFQRGSHGPRAFPHKRDKEVRLAHGARMAEERCGWTGSKSPKEQAPQRQQGQSTPAAPSGQEEARDALLPRLSFRGRSDQQGDLSFRRMFLVMSNKLCGRSSPIFFKGLCELPRNTNLPFRTAPPQGLKCAQNAVRRLEVDTRAVTLGSSRDLCRTASALDRKKSAEKEPVARKPRSDKRCCNRRRPREHGDRKAALDTRTDQPMAGIGNSRHSGIRN